MDKFIDEIKQDIYKGIEEEKLRMEEKYSNDKLKVEKVNTVPEAIKELVNIYGNSLEQRKVMTPILEKYLEADFFKNAEVIRGANYIIFNKGEYSIGFSTSRLYGINIRRTENLRKPIEPLPVRKEILEFNELWDYYKETGEGYDYVVDYYSIMTRAMEAGFIFRRRVKKSTIEQYAEMNKQHIESVNQKMKRWKEDLEDYEKEKELFYETIRDVRNDLIKFRNAGWYIKDENLKGLEDYKNLM